jgi:two-component system chemotaxis response regulator CheY
MRVMIVDDSSTMRKIETTQLSNLGITDVIQAENGRDALEKLGENMPIDVILLDINMPVMDGMTMLRRMRENKVWSKVKVIMVTSESEKNKVVEAIYAGANDYMVKPFKPENFKRKLTGT